MSKKSVPANFLKSIFFYGHFNRFKYAKFFQFFSFQTEKFLSTPKNRARTAELSVPIDSAEKYIEICILDVWENFFGEALSHSSKLFVVKKRR